MIPRRRSCWLWSSKEVVTRAWWAGGSSSDCGLLRPCLGGLGARRGHRGWGWARRAVMRPCSSCERAWFSPVVVLEHVSPSPPMLARVLCWRRWFRRIGAGRRADEVMARGRVACPRPSRVASDGWEWSPAAAGLLVGMMRVWSSQVVEVNARGFALVRRSLLRRITRTLLPTRPSLRSGPRGRTPAVRRERCRLPTFIGETGRTDPAHQHPRRPGRAPHPWPSDAARNGVTLCRTRPKRGERYTPAGIH
jgi:hypothetical protein